MLTYFEIQDRIENLQQFRSLYRDYLKYPDRLTNDNAIRVREQMHGLAPLTVDSLKRVGLGRIATRTAKTRGDRPVQINVIKALFRDNIIQDFQIDDETPIKLIDRAILAWQQKMWRQKLQLFNPLFWLYHFFGFLAELPISLLRRARYDTSRFDEHPAVKAYVLLVQLLLFWVFFEAVGLVDWVLARR